MIPHHIASVARVRGYDPAVVAAIVKVESGSLGGLAADGRPIILYEPHVAYRNCSGPARDHLVAAGLAWKVWRPGTYPRSQAARWKQFDDCARIAGANVAIEACSWGLGQVLGENWTLCRYQSPAAFREAQATLGGQVETMMRFLEGNDLRAAIIARDWNRIARVYNGPKHAEHDYAGRMARAYEAAKAGGEAPPPPPDVEPVPPVPPVPSGGFLAALSRLIAAIFGRRA